MNVKSLRLHRKPDVHLIMSLQMPLFNIPRICAYSEIVP